MSKDNLLFFFMTSLASVCEFKTKNLRSEIMKLNCVRSLKRNFVTRVKSPAPVLEAMPCKEYRDVGSSSNLGGGHDTSRALFSLNNGDIF